MEHYYETAHNDSGEVVEHETLEKAIEYAEAHGIDLICEIGGPWDEYKKCEWCGEWYDHYEIEENNGICNRCHAAIRSRGERW